MAREGSAAASVDAALVGVAWSIVQMTSPAGGETDANDRAALVSAFADTYRALKAALAEPPAAGRVRPGLYGG